MVKKKLGPKLIVAKEIWTQNKFLGSNRNLSKELTKENGIRKSLGQKIRTLSAKKIYVQKNSWVQKRSLVGIKFRSKKILVPRIFLVKKCFGSKKNLVEKIMSYPKRIESPKNFQWKKMLVQKQIFCCQYIQGLRFSWVQVGQ